MGKVMSHLGSRVSRINIESRTHKLLDKGEKIAAPKFEGNIRDLERAQKTIPNLADKLNTKDISLDDRLKRVFVTSQDKSIVPDPEKININRPLPTDTKRQEDYDYGHLIPENVTPGKVSLKQAIQFISDHQTDPKKFPLPLLVEQYKLKEEDMFNILQYYKAFKLHVPDPKKTKFIANPDRAKDQALMARNRK